MKNITRDNLTDTVKSSFANIDGERQRHLVNRLVHHLHAFASETGLSHDEWRDGIAFLHRMAEISSPSRSEFTLLSDVLGLSSLVDLLAARPGATEGSVLGPFHTRGSPWVDNGSNLINQNEGEAVLIQGRVTDTDGQPLANASIDFWQNADNGMYWQMDDSQPQDNLRCQLKVQADGRFELATIRPRPYMVPTDGPVGELLRMSHRDAWRPAHFHIIVEATGYRSLITEVFDEADPWVDKDAVFGVRASLVRPFTPASDAATAERMGLPAQYLSVELPIRLARED
ncbi:dioxygenase family protein [Limnohabitans sp. 63ED37-2]|uniref:dioxygenase family protein n=1 Tax=Limnohabitans sp. 63ED37-2 TaxID=1678128 RepID=UPI0007061C43|nr:dioxygenase [Limnohabitans sp. 63ED37-2]ALK88425.1 Hydroxyquinol 1,2-dioxygenase [Limnohabitans sp. 63ED37-2]